MHAILLVRDLDASHPPLHPCLEGQSSSNQQNRTRAARRRRKSQRESTVTGKGVAGSKANRDQRRSFGGGGCPRAAIIARHATARQQPAHNCTATLRAVAVQQPTSNFRPRCLFLLYDANNDNKYTKVGKTSIIVGTARGVYRNIAYRYCAAQKSPPLGAAPTAEGRKKNEKKKKLPPFFSASSSSFHIYASEFARSTLPTVGRDGVGR